MFILSNCHGYDTRLGFIVWYLDCLEWLSLCSFLSELKTYKDPNPEEMDGPPPTKRPRNDSHAYSSFDSNPGKFC